VNESPGSIKGGEFPKQLVYCQLPKNDTISWSLLVGSTNIAAVFNVEVAAI
jgi:hypothetical protein